MRTAEEKEELCVCGHGRKSHYHGRGRCVECAIIAWAYCVHYKKKGWC